MSEEQYVSGDTTPVRTYGDWWRAQVVECVTVGGDRVTVYVGDLEELAASGDIEDGRVPEWTPSAMLPGRRPGEVDEKRP